MGKGKLTGLMGLLGFAMVFCGSSAYAAEAAPHIQLNGTEQENVYEVSVTGLDSGTCAVELHFAVDGEVGDAEFTFSDDAETSYRLQEIEQEDGRSVFNMYLSRLTPIPGAGETVTLGTLSVKSGEKLRPVEDSGSLNAVGSGYGYESKYSGVTVTATSGSGGDNGTGGDNGSGDPGDGNGGGNVDEGDKPGADGNTGTGNTGDTNTGGGSDADSGGKDNGKPQTVSDQAGAVKTAGKATSGRKAKPDAEHEKTGQAVVEGKPSAEGIQDQELPAENGGDENPRSSAASTEEADRGTETPHEQVAGENLSVWIFVAAAAALLAAAVIVIVIIRVRKKRNGNS